MLRECLRLNEKIRKVKKGEEKGRIKPKVFSFRQAKKIPTEL